MYEYYDKLTVEICYSKNNNKETVDRIKKKFWKIFTRNIEKLFRIWKRGYCMTKKLLRIASILEISGGVLLYISTKELIIPLLLVASGLLFLISGFLYNNDEENKESK